LCSTHRYSSSASLKSASLNRILPVPVE
jgi:hypothetical protein